MRFPKVSGSNLERRSFRLPTDLEGDLNLLILAFWRDHQMLVDTWMPLARRLQDRHPGLATYELPVIESRSRLSRWFIDRGMRAGIPDQVVRAHTITLYTDKSSFLEQLGIRDDTTIQALLVTPAGQIVSRTSGALDPGKETELSAFLDRWPTFAD